MEPLPPPFDALWFQTTIGTIIGLCLGSFITMLSYRLPRRISIVMPPSQCPSCHHTLKPGDLVPLFSWLIAKGRCRYCRHKIGSRYILIELATAALSAASFAFIGFSPLVVPALFFVVIVMTVTTIYIERRQG